MFFHALKILFQRVKFYFNGLKFYFNGLKILFHGLKKLFLFTFETFSLRTRNKTKPDSWQVKYAQSARRAYLRHKKRSQDLCPDSPLLLTPCFYL